VRTTVVALALVTATVCSFVAYALRPLADDILLNFAGIHELLARGSVFEVLSGWNFRPVGYRLWLTVEHAIVSPFTALPRSYETSWSPPCIRTRSAPSTRRRR